MKKSSIKLLSLSLVVVAILVFWLMPRMNKAGNINYSRVYENTDRKPKVIVTEVLPEVSTDTGKVKKTTKKPTEVKSTDKKSEVTPVQREKKSGKEYKKEVIGKEFKLKDVKPYMYSRAIHFNPEDEIVLQESPLPVADSVKVEPTEEIADGEIK